MIDVLFPVGTSGGLRIRYPAARMRACLREYFPEPGDELRWDIICKNTPEPEEYTTVTLNNSWYIRFHHDADATYFLLKWSNNEKV